MKAKCLNQNHIKSSSKFSNKEINSFPAINISQNFIKIIIFNLLYYNTARHILNLLSTLDVLPYDFIYTTSNCTSSHCRPSTSQPTYISLRMYNYLLTIRLIFLFTTLKHTAPIPSPLYCNPTHIPLHHSNTPFTTPLHSPPIPHYTTSPHSLLTGHYTTFLHFPPTPHLSTLHPHHTIIIIKT